MRKSVWKWVSTIFWLTIFILIVVYLFMTVNVKTGVQRYGQIWRMARQPYMGRQEEKPICAGVSIEWAYRVLYNRSCPLSGLQIWLRSAESEDEGITMVDGFYSVPELRLDAYGTAEFDMKLVTRMIDASVPVLIGHRIGNGHHMAPLIAVSDSGWLVLLNTIGPEWSPATYYMNIRDVEEVWYVAKDESYQSIELYLERRWDWEVSDVSWWRLTH